jgi:hypothetical protein
MSSVANQSALEVFAFLAQLTGQIAALRRQLLRSKSERGWPITEVSSAVECHQYQSRLVVSAWIEAALATECALTWWLDLEYTEAHWLLCATVSWNGRATVVKLPELTVADFQQVQREAPRLLAALFTAGEQILTNTRLSDRAAA